jgi:Leucine-rich repeat (LRR) protein
MPGLETLTLSRCGVEFDAAGQATLSTLTRLKELDLYGNPLGTAPDIRTLPALTTLDLTRTGISQIPVGVGQSLRLRDAFLGENAIVELPEDLRGLSANGVVLRANPLSTASRERIKIFSRDSYQYLGVTADPEEIALVRALYPAISEVEANRLIYRLPGTLAEGHSELLRRHNNLTTLLGELDVWVRETPRDPLTGTELEGEALRLENARRMGFRDNLEGELRKAPRYLPSTEVTLDLSLNGELPVLSGRFEQIRELTLTSTANVPPRVDRLLELFPNLEELNIKGYPLNEIPLAVFDMNQLTDLRLPRCRIVLTEQTVNALAAMKNLEGLDLSHNPLGRAPDLRNLQKCQTLRLNNTGLTDVPTGLFGLQRLTYADLSENAIAELPDPLPAPGDDRPVTYNFSENPLSPRSQRSLATYNAANDLRLLEERRRMDEIHRALEDFENSDFSNGEEQP